MSESALLSAGPLISGDSPPLRILRVADVPAVATSGTSGYMLSSAAEMERRGHRVSFWFKDQLAPALGPAGVRRLLVPWLILVKVIAATLRREHFDVVEIHEPLSAPYALIARILRLGLPTCAVMSHGLEARAWQAQLEHQRKSGGKPRLRSRVLVPLTLLSQARVGLTAAETVLVLSTAATIPSSDVASHPNAPGWVTERRLAATRTISRAWW